MFSAASSLDAAVVTAKVGMAAAAGKAAYDFLAELQGNAHQVLELAGALAAVYLLAKFTLWAAAAARGPQGTGAWRAL